MLEVIQLGSMGTGEIYPGSNGTWPGPKAEELVHAQNELPRIPAVSPQIAPNREYPVSHKEELVPCGWLGCLLFLVYFSRRNAVGFPIKIVKQSILFVKRFLIKSRDSTEVARLEVKKTISFHMNFLSSEGRPKFEKCLPGSANFVLNRQTFTDWNSSMLFSNSLKSLMHSLAWNLSFHWYLWKQK